MPSLYCIPRQVVLSKNLFQFHSLYEWWAFICDLLGRFCWVWVAFGTALLHLVHLCAKGMRVQWSQDTRKLYEEHSSKYNSFMRNPALWRKGTALPRRTVAYRRKSAGHALQNAEQMETGSKVKGGGMMIPQNTRQEELTHSQVGCAAGGCTPSR